MGIKTLEIKNRSLEDKLSSLESADLFLQESYRQLSDKTVKIESDFRKSDDNLNFLYKQLHEEIEGKIKGQITDIYFEINELQQEKIGMNEKIDEMENNMEKNKNIVGSFEKSMPEVIKKVNMDMDKKVKDIQLSHENEFTKIANSLKEENNLTNNTMDDKLKDIDVNYQQVLQKMNEDKNENENQFKVLKDESQSNTQNIINIQESLYIQSEQVKKVDAERQQSMKKEKEDVQATILGNASAIGDLKRELEKTINEMSKMNVIETRLKSSEDDIKHLDDSIDGLKRNNLLNIEERIKQNADQIKHIDDTIDGLHKTVAIFEGRHVETVEKMKEVTVLTSNIQVQVSEQAQKMVEQSSNDLNQIRDQIQDIENQNGLSNQKISELDSGNQALLEKLLGLEKSIVDRMEGLDKTDDNLLTKINGLQTDNAQSLADFGKDLDNKLAQHDKNYQVEHDSIRSETHILNQHLEEVKSLHVATEKRIVEMDAGNQQLLEKLLGVEKDLDGKLQGVNDNANSLVTKLNSLDNDTKNNSQTIVNLQESIYIQTEQVKKVDAERQQAEAKNKEDMENTVSTNAKAIADLKAELGDAITKIEITLKEEQTKDNSSLIDRLTIVQDATTSNQGRIESLEKAGPESIQNFVLEIDNKLKGYDESASQKLREAEDKIQKNTQDIASHSNLLREHTENINTFISTNATFTNQFHALETKSEDFLKYLQVERQRIGNMESGLNGLDETVQKALPDIKRNRDRIDDFDARQTNLGKTLDDTFNQVQDNFKEIASLKQVLGNQNSNLGDVEERLKQNENQIKHIDDTIDGLHKTVAIFESRHVETVEKKKEVTVLASNIQVQVSEQAQKMVEQS